MVCTSAGVNGFLPTVIFEFGGVSQLESNLLSAIPNFLAIFSLFFASRHSDKTGERFWHSSIGLIVGLLGVALCGLSVYLGSLTLFMVCSIVYALGFWAGHAVFMSYMTSTISGSPAVAIGLYNSVSTFGGWVGPFILGVMRDKYGNHTPGFIVMAAFAVVSVSVLAFIRKIYEHQTKVQFIPLTALVDNDEDVPVE